MQNNKSAEIIAIGTELLLGDIVNTNAQFIARELSNMGINVYYQSVVGDNPQRLESMLTLAKSRADIIITTGGLGPTYDDLTKETIAKNFGKKLVMHEPSRRKIEHFFQKVNREMTQNNIKQAYMPEDGIVFENKNGTAPGCALQDENGKIAIMLPGPPSEMKPMFLNNAIPYLEQFCDSVIASKTLFTIGIGESALEDILADMMKTYTNPTIAPYAKEGECILRVTAKADTKEQAIALIDPVIEQIREKIGIYIYGVDVGSLEAAVVGMLKEKGLKVALAESCTGGFIAKRLTDVAGSSEVFEMGIVAYANEVKEDLLNVDPEIIKTYGAVSSQCAVAMAKGVFELSGCDIALSVTGVAGPGQSESKPTGLVYMALYDGEKTWVKKLSLPERMRDFIRLASTNYGLDMIRRGVLHWD